MITLLLLALGQAGTSSSDCPDLVHFTSSKQLFLQNDLNTTFQNWAKVQASLGGWRADWYQEQVDEAQGWYQRYLALLKARDRWSTYQDFLDMKEEDSAATLNAQDDYFDALAYLQWFLGPEAFSLGAIGPPIPLWYFQR